MAASQVIEQKLTRDAVQAAAIVLGIENIDTVEVEAVNAAYRRVLRGVHPDVAAVAVDAGYQITVVRTARNMLLDWIRDRPDAECSMCRGSGWIRGVGFTSRPCPRCSGS